MLQGCFTNILSKYNSFFKTFEMCNHTIPVKFWAVLKLENMNNQNSNEKSLKKT
jgi:hypothetical protein